MVEAVFENLKKKINDFGRDGELIHSKRIRAPRRVCMSKPCKFQVKPFMRYLTTDRKTHHFELSGPL